ncbi:hypothetical protein AK812_SmicGene43962 [Symbiodinium microadriaticum]|uniref:Uncharacterized protein n=1 Tax=Symbiodinium microadriaticum TaxID=2951 RepID=A0A1Q9BZN1_SYMMI|nr:hypothetical protein AK812_SmicGene43962 [Symbiodinium microadriaticum]
MQPQITQTTRRSILEREEALEVEGGEVPSDLDATDTPMPSIGKEYGLVGKGPKASTGDKASESDEDEQSDDDEDEGNEDERDRVLKQMKFPDLQGSDSLTSIAVAICNSLQKRMAKLALLDKKISDLQNPLDLHRQMGEKITALLDKMSSMNDYMGSAYGYGLVNGFKKQKLKELKHKFAEARSLPLPWLCRQLQLASMGGMQASETVIDLDRAEQYAEMLGSGVEASEVLDDMLHHLAKELVELFETGLQVCGQQWYVCCLGHKGDLKHMAEKSAHLVRSYAHMGHVNSIMMCSVCEAGAPGIPWDRIELDPIWSSSLYASRPWAKDPPLLAVPFDNTRPEMFYRFDLFHLIKVGLGRDIAGGLVLLAKWGFWDGDGDIRNLPARLDRAHMAFKMWASASGRTPALRSFKMGLFNMKNMTDFAWTNTKGSDTMLLLEFIRWTCDLHLGSPTPQSRPHEELLRLYRQTIGHTLKIFDICNHHGLWLSRSCAQNLFANLMCMLSGYISLAKMTCDMNETFFSIKPKLHATHHVAFEIQQMLHTTAPLIPNPLMYACEGNESHVGHICDLAQVVDTRLISKRVVERHFCKVAAVLRRHVESR